ncbi:hypothetical protein DM860_002659 [Cuscuta australis]|uniref:Uncharacterized protein n=1 Tax=Cuscuta australis TaxID=267555 RepID=A0A328D2P7_9ASTE|nr:hypothetical protein DM860_002659 [Cuscuta australis]
MGHNNKNNVRKNQNQNITIFVFDGTPISEGKTCKIDGINNDKHQSACLLSSIEIVQTSASSSTDVSVTLNSLDAIATEDNSLDICEQTRLNPTKTSCSCYCFEGHWTGLAAAQLLLTFADYLRWKLESKWHCGATRLGSKGLFSMLKQCHDFGRP